MQIKGIASFPNCFTAKVPKAGGDAKFGIGLLLAPTDPQIAGIQAEYTKAVADSFPNGMPRNVDVCWGPYDDFFLGKEYYDPRFKGWWYFKCSSKEDQKPTVVNSALQPVMDPAKLFGGAVVWVHAGMSGYTKGTGGIGGWLNGVMVTDEEPPMGRLDNKPSAEQMFANLPTSHQTHLAAGAIPHVAANGATITPPGNLVAAPPVIVPPVTTPPQPMMLMTPKAGGGTYEAHIAAGWTDESLIAHGMAIRSTF